MKKVICLIAVMLVLMVFSNVYAFNIFDGEILRETINGARVYTGDEITVDKHIDGSLISVGNLVKVDSDIYGVSLVLGEKVNMSGITDYLLAIGNTVDLKDAVYKDAFIIGTNVTTSKDSYFGRDSLICANVLNLSGKIERDIKINANVVQIHDAKILGNISIDADEIIISGDTKIFGTLTYYDNSIVDMANTVEISDVNILDAPAIKGLIDETILTLIIITKGYALIAILVVSLLLAGLTPIFTKLDDVLKKKLNVVDVMLVMLKGCLILFLGPILMCVLLLTLIGIPVALILLVLYFMGIWLSKVMTGYIIIKCLFKNKKVNTVVAVILGILLITILSNIPFVGGIVKALSLVFGMGTFTYIFKHKKNSTDLSNVVKE